MLPNLFKTLFFLRWYSAEASTDRRISFFISTAKWNIHNRSCSLPVSSVSYTTLTHLWLPLESSVLPPLTPLSLEKSSTKHWYLAIGPVQKFNFERKRIFNQVVNAALPVVSTNTYDIELSVTTTPSQRLFFLDAPGRTGKTFVTSAIQRFLKSRGKRVLALGSLAFASQ